MALQDFPQIQQLTIKEKLQLVGDLWDDIAAISDNLPVSEEEKRLLDERLKAHEASPETAMTFEEFKKSLAKRL